MAISALDSKTALIVIDLQKGAAALPTVHPLSKIVERSAALLEAFRRRGLPVALVSTNGAPAGRTERGPPLSDMSGDFAELIPKLNPQPGDHRVTKRARDAFAGGDLETWLKGQGVTQVVLVGLATSAGIESTARRAHDLGFNVALAIDAMTDMNPHTHANSIMRIFPSLGETGTTLEILSLLERMPG